MMKRKQKKADHNRTGKTSKRKNIVKAKKTEQLLDVEHTDHQIPTGYDIDTIVIMPVNKDTSFIYWEVTDRLLNGSQRKLKTGSARLMVKVFENESLTEVCSFEVQERIGKNYIHYRPSFKPLIAEIGIMNGRGFVGLLKSGTPSSSPHNPSSTKKKSSGHAPASEKSRAMKRERPFIDSSGKEYEMWMTKTGDKQEITRLPQKYTGDTALTQYYKKSMRRYRGSIFSGINVKKG